MYKPVGKGTSPLLLAVQNDHFELAIALVDAGADPNDQRTGFTALHTLTWVRKPDSSDVSEPPPLGSGRITSLQFVREIVKRGVNVNLRLGKGAPKVPQHVLAHRHRGGDAAVSLRRGSFGHFVDARAPGVGRGSSAAKLQQHDAVDGCRRPRNDRAARRSRRRTRSGRNRENAARPGADVNAVDNNGDTAMHGAAYKNYPLVVKLLADRGANPKIWNQPNKQGVTPLFAAEGHIERLPRPHPPTIDAVTRLMLAAGLSTGGKRPVVVDIYEKPAAPPEKPARPEKP